MYTRAFHLSSTAYFALDYAIAYGAMICGIVWSPYYGLDNVIAPWNAPDIGGFSFVIPFAMALGLQISGLQKNEAGFDSTSAIVRILEGLFLGYIVLLIIGFAVNYAFIGRRVILVSIIYATFLICASRMVTWNIAERQIWRVFAIGEKSAINVLRTLVANERIPIEVISVDITSSSTEVGVASSIRRIADGNAIAIDDSSVVSGEVTSALLEAIADGQTVISFGGVYEQFLKRVYLAGLNAGWFWSYDPTYNHPALITAKRCSDVVLSIIGGLTAVPIVCFACALVWLEDRGPVFYTQRRVGLKNRQFTIYKIRTMSLAAEKTGPQWAKEGDGRVTAVGKVLRRMRLDELPQFWNIFIGNMSFVGPRPERPEFVRIIEREVPYYRFRHVVKPGLTGWAQINYPYGASIEDARKKLAYDLFYVKRLSIGLDAVIVLRTVSAMMRGAR